MNEFTPKKGSCRSWQALTTTEIRAAGPNAVVILPIASTEQHGDHLATGTDAVINDELQRRILQDPPASGHHLLLPTLTIGSSDHHLAFGGTLTVPPILYAQFLRSALHGLLRQGHQRIFVLNSHGGNESPLRTALAEIAHSALDRHALVAGVSYWHLCQARWKEDLPTVKTFQMGHACELETSMIMAARPELHRRTKVRVRDNEIVRDEPFRWAPTLPFNGISMTGTTGYPSSATAETGRILLEGATHCLRETLATFAEHPLPEDHVKTTDSLHYMLSDEFRTT